MFVYDRSKIQSATVAVQLLTVVDYILERSTAVHCV